MTQTYKRDDAKELPENEESQQEENQNVKYSDQSRTEAMTEELPSEATTVSTAEEEAKLLKDQLLRALAEADNIRKRAQREKEDTARFAIANFARDLLTVADNLTRALENLPTDKQENNEVLSSIVEGIRITEKELSNALDRHGIKKVFPLGEPFDHNFHQAMFEEESLDYEAGKVCRVLQTGYTLHDRLLRPALVSVAKVKSS